MTKETLDIKCGYAKQYTHNSSGNDLYKCRAYIGDSFCPSYLNFGGMGCCTKGKVKVDNYKK